MAEQTTDSSRPRRGAVITLIVIGSLIGVLAIFSVWIARQVLETDTWTETSTELLEEDDIREPVAGFLVDALFTNVDVEAELRNALPADTKGLSGPAAGGLRQLADQAADEALQRPRIQQLWAGANATAHSAFVKIVEDKGDRVSTAGGAVTLDLSQLLDQLGTQVGVDVSGKLPPDAGRIEILDSDELSTAQEVFGALRKLAVGLTLLTLGLFALAIYLARGWRRRAVRAVGFGFVASGLAVLAARSLGQSLLVSSLASTASSEDAVRSTLDIFTSLLRASALSVIAYGLVIVLGAWLAGPGRLASSVRRDLTPLIRDRAVAYALLAFLLLLLFWWNPTPGTARLLTSLTLVVLLVAGMEALRHQALADFPEETMGTATARWRGRVAGLRDAGSGRRQATSGEAARLDELERLARLRDAGALSPEEFEREKSLLLGSAPPQA
ncbi:MAG TPA: SHOCT domain-containing protein [Solirubrobacterales bacterium]|nr:SHOCT domain-containing protein [Solirubrobacterales bacterium]